MQNLTGAQKALYQATLNFNLNELKMTEEDAKADAMAKINRTLKMVSKLKFKH